MSSILTEVKHSVSMIENCIVPTIRLNIPDALPKIREYMATMPSHIWRIQSVGFSYDKVTNTFSSECAAFPSQITFVTGVKEPKYKIKVTVKGTVQIPGAMGCADGEIDACLSSILRCLEVVCEIAPLSISPLESRMLNYKFHVRNGLLDFYRMYKHLLEYEVDKVRLDFEHLRYFVHSETLTRDDLDIITRSYRVPCRLNLNFDSLTRVLRARNYQMMDDVIEIIDGYFPSEAAALIDKYLWKDYINDVVADLYEEPINQLWLFVRGENENTIVLNFIPPENVHKTCIVQIYSTGKININNGINSVVTSRIYRWLENFFSLYPDCIVT